MLQFMQYVLFFNFIEHFGQIILLQFSQINDFPDSIKLEGIKISEPQMLHLIGITSLLPIISTHQM